MYDAAEQAGVVHLLGTELRYDPGPALLARTVRGGAIGEPKLATALLHIPLLASAGAAVPDWWGDPAQGGGWLGAHAPHVIDLIRMLLGDIAGVSASLPHVGSHEWRAEDAYLVHLRAQSGAVGVLQSVASDRGPMLFVTRVVGSEGTAWVEGSRVQVASASGTRDVPMPPDLDVPAPEPPPADLLATEYDMLHSFGLEFGPYVKLAGIFRDRIDGRSVVVDPEPATFADGVVSMRVLDAIRASAARGSEWIDVVA
jgi:predicted dehydrogenase